MAHIEVPFGDKHHITIIHFNNLNFMAAIKLRKELETLKAEDFPPPVITFKGKSMFGRYRNIPVMKLSSEFITKCREKCEEICQKLEIPYSKDYEYNPHITRPGEFWPEDLVSHVAPILSFRYKDSTGKKHTVKHNLKKK